MDTQLITAKSKYSLMPDGKLQYIDQVTETSQNKVNTNELKKFRNVIDIVLDKMEFPRVRSTSSKIYQKFA